VDQLGSKQTGAETESKRNYDPKVLYWIGPQQAAEASFFVTNKLGRKFESCQDRIE
jgi:hypothetical protein